MNKSKTQKVRNMALAMHLAGAGNRGAGKHANKKHDFLKGRTRKQKHKIEWK